MTRQCLYQTISIIACLDPMNRVTKSIQKMQITSGPGTIIVPLKEQLSAIGEQKWFRLTALQLIGYK
ncbi:hypothetical protein SAMN05216311_103497 [Chitinophaga sp. CF418]|nr:hypothetical protein SAMN05216311_103497 [Chitinophaga sp. CF418]